MILSRDTKPVLRRARRGLFRAVAAVSLAAAALLAPAAHAEDRPLRLGTSTAGGGFSLYGETLARVINERAGRPLVEAVGTGGTGENVKRLAAGELDIALVQGTVASRVLQSADERRLAIFYAMYPSQGMMAVPTASPARRLEDLKGQPIVFGVGTSGLVVLARQVFGGIGMDIDRDFQALYVDRAGQSPPLVIEGRAAGLWGAGEGWPGFERLAEAPGGARFLAPDEGQIRDILKAHPFLSPMTVPAGAYPGIDAPLRTVGSWNLIMARPDLPEAAGYRVARALHDAAADLGAALPQAADSTAANTAEATPDAALLHPGTAHLLRELGLVPG